MKNYLVILLILLLNFSIGCSKSNGVQSQPFAENRILIEKASKSVALLYNESNPKIVNVKENIEEVNKKPMYIVLLKGNFSLGDKTCNGISFSMSADGKQLWAIRGFDVNNKTVWESMNINLPDLIDYNLLLADQVVSIAIQGDLRLRTKIFYLSNAKDKIKKIIYLINSGSSKRASTKEEVNAVHSFASPYILTIKMKNRNKVNVFLLSTNIVDCKFVINTNSDTEESYYTLSSKELFLYLKKGI